MSTNNPSRRLSSVLFAPVRLVMLLTGHRPDQEVTPVQVQELVELAHARHRLAGLRSDYRSGNFSGSPQEALEAIKAAETLVRDLDDMVAGGPSRVPASARH